MFKTLTLMFAFLLPVSVSAADSVTISDCAAGSAKITYTVDNDDVLVVWDGSDDDNSVHFPVSSTGSISQQIQQDFADLWGGSSNSSISVYVLSASGTSDSCD